MLAFLPNLLGHSDKALGTLMHIGAGVGTELATYESIRIKSIIAIESDNTLFKKLQAKAKRYQNVVAINGWVADTNEERIAYKVSNPRFNSLLEPRELFSNFTNLKTVSSNSIKPFAISELVRERIEASPTQQNILVLDIQGFESTLLSGCAKVELHKFDWVIIKSSKQALYQSALHQTQLVEMINTLGYELTLHDETHTPFVEYYFRLNREGISNKELEVKLHANDEYIEQLLATVTDLNSHLDMAQKQCEEQLEFDKQSLQLALNQSKKDCELNEIELQRVKKENSKILREQEELLSKLSKFNEANEAQKQQLIEAELTIVSHKQRQENDKNQINELITQKSELETKLDEVRKNLEEQTHWHHENKKWRDEVTVEKEKLELAYNQLQKHIAEIEASNETNVAKLNSQIVSLENDLKKYKTWVENLKKEIEILGTELKSKSGNIDLGQMMLAKSNLDLEHLRESYKAKVASEKVLVDLIAELRQKLLQASKYYFQLQKEHPELLSPSKNLENE